MSGYYWNTPTSNGMQPDGRNSTRPTYEGPSATPYSSMLRQQPTMQYQQSYGDPAAQHDSNSVMNPNVNGEPRDCSYCGESQGSHDECEGTYNRFLVHKEVARNPRPYLRPDNRYHPHPHPLSHPQSHPQAPPAIPQWVSPYERAALFQQSFPKSNETKPRFSKSEVEQLEAEFQKNPKPNGNLKKGLAELMCVEVARINNWFQNRRAKAKHERRRAEESPSQKSEKQSDEAGPPEIKEFFPNGEKHDTLRPSTAAFPVPPISSEPAPSALIITESQSAEALEIVSTPENKTMSSPQLTSPHVVVSSASASDDGLNEQDFSAFMNTTDGQDFLSVPSADSFMQFPFPTDAASNFSLYFPSDMDNVDAAASQSSAITDQSHVSTIPNTVATPDQSWSSSPTSHSPTASSPVGKLASPRLDIASRRKRPPVTPISLRTVSCHQGSKSALEFPGSGRRSESISPLRRVASATGLGRIQKSSSISGPSSRTLHSGHHEALLTLATRNPLMNIPVNMSTETPPTPDTPINAIQPCMLESMPTTTSGLTIASTDVFPTELTLVTRPLPDISTPPTTPGLVTSFDESIFTTPINGGFAYGMTDDMLSQFGSFDTGRPGDQLYMQAMSDAQSMAASGMLAFMPHNYGANMMSGVGQDFGWSGNAM